VLVLLYAALFLALGSALVVVASNELTISATFRESAAALAGADAAIVRASADLAVAPDLNAVLNGSDTSAFVDGPAAAPRTMPDGTVVDLAGLGNIERCGAVVCAVAQLDAVTAERPWGANNPRWQRYASGWLKDLAPQAGAPRVYVVVWVADDPLERDGDPLTDDPDPDAPGHDAVLIRAAAYAAYAVRRRLEVVARRDQGVVRLASWREVR
jgi:hypothetical protein